jgi:hypothetical protein
MKKNLRKYLALIVLFAGSIFISNAQEIGLRFGDVSAGNVAIDGIFSTGDFSRIHADVSFGNGLGVDALWDFVYRPLGDEALNWYAGVGPYIQIADPFWLGVVGEIGIDYQFDTVPISLSFDWRPAVSIVEVTDFHPGGFGLNVRYVIGKN